MNHYNNEYYPDNLSIITTSGVYRGVSTKPNTPKEAVSTIRHNPTKIRNGVVVVDCSARRIPVQDGVQDETKACQGVNPPMPGK